ncbi:MAG TPA: hypothetical protein VJB14_12000 [Planctomycetota bacterium]|nr:hypothetical protein [Planctomycetota bacterium]
MSPPMTFRGVATGLIVQGRRIGAPGSPTTVTVNGVSGEVTAFSEGLLTGALTTEQTAVVGESDVIVVPPGDDTEPPGETCPPPPIIIVDPTTPEEALKVFSPQVGFDVKSFVDEAQDKVDRFIQRAVDAPTRAEVTTEAESTKTEITSAKTLVIDTLDQQKEAALQVVRALGGTDNHIQVIKVLAEKGRQAIREHTEAAKTAVGETAGEIKRLKPS